MIHKGDVFELLAYYAGPCFHKKKTSCAAQTLPVVLNTVVLARRRRSAAVSRFRPRPISEQKTRDDG
ncbi:hypothetical protein ANCCAN_28256 [Ancylostoma caninum]|uniref:Uncharacterized protein n=1 Tax=Ancylostoma caninum TaxID=29170 RepID=A0A368F1P6_ANCCA|nr:hypothetical protein ANCCAN_28256 [Ancylostoma caninum]